MRPYMFLTLVCLRKDFSLSHTSRNSPGFSLSVLLYTHQTSAESGNRVVIAALRVSRQEDIPNIGKIVPRRKQKLNISLALSKNQTNVSWWEAKWKSCLRGVGELRWRKRLWLGDACRWFVLKELRYVVNVLGVHLFVLNQRQARCQNAETSILIHTTCDTTIGLFICLL